MLVGCRALVVRPHVGVRYATKKSGGISTNGRDSIGRRLGLKKSQNEFVNPGNIIIRQRGFKWHPGVNVGVGRDHTLWALVPGYVRFTKNPETERTFVSVMDRPRIYIEDVAVEEPVDKTQERHAWRQFTDQRRAAVKKALGPQPTLPELKGVKLAALKAEGLDVLREEADRLRAKRTFYASNLPSELDKLPNGGALAEQLRRLLAPDPKPTPAHIAKRIPKLLNAPPQSLGTAKTLSALLPTSRTLRPRNSTERMIRRAIARRKAAGLEPLPTPAPLEYKPGVGVVFPSQHVPGSARWVWEQKMMNRRYGLWEYEHPVREFTAEATPAAAREPASPASSGEPSVADSVASLSSVTDASAGASDPGTASPTTPPSTATTP